MGVGTLIFGDRVQRSIGFVNIDLLENETITLPTEVTTEPTELGFDIVDNTILLPVQISLSFYVSDYSIAPNTSLSDSANAYELLKLQRALRLPTIYTNDIDIFVSYIMTEVSLNRNAETGRGIPFEVTLQEVITVPPLGIILPQSIIGGGLARSIASAVTL